MPAPATDSRTDHRWGVKCVLVIVCAFLLACGCDRSEEADVELLYDWADYEMAEAAVTGQVRIRLDDRQIEMRDLWLGLRPVNGASPALNADVDACCAAEDAEEISRMVAEICLNALPRHDRVQVRVFWWSERPGDDFAHLAGAWTWGADGSLIEHIQPKDLHDRRQDGRG